MIPKIYSFDKGCNSFFWIVSALLQNPQMAGGLAYGGGWQLYIYAMLSRHRHPVSLSWTATNLPLQADFDTFATLYPKDRDRFHLFLRIPPAPTPSAAEKTPLATASGLLWLEIAPHRVVLTLQGRDGQGYRHFWERGVYGKSRYWVQDAKLQQNSVLSLQNFTRSLYLHQISEPRFLHIEYELWTDKLALGCYQLDLDIHA